MQAPATHVLDPSSTERVGSIRGASLLLSERARAQRKIPNFDAMSFGDVVLFEPVRPGPVDRLIQKAQRKGGFDEVHARWTHAAIYAGYRFVIEAAVSGVRYADLCDYTGKYRLCVRRAPALAPSQCYELVIQASARLGQRYSIGTATRIGFNSLRGFWNYAALLEGVRGNICSKLYSDCYLAISGRTIIPGDLPVTVTPAHLSRTDALCDVRVGWVDLK
jgi:hypothetical protein